MTPAYTAYSRSLCPVWCTEGHDEEMPDPKDPTAVAHAGACESLKFTGSWGPALVGIHVERWDSFEGANAGPQVVVEDGHLPREMKPEHAVQVGLALIRAAEAARRG